MDLRRRFASGDARGAALAGVLLCLCAAWAGCRGGADVAEPAWLPGAGSALPEPAPTFSGARALEEAHRLAEHPDRSPGSGDADRARRDIEASLHRAGARTEWLAPGPTGSVPRAPAPGEPEAGATGALLGILPGRSDDVILLVARYDAEADETNEEADRLEAASGAAVLLELGRALAARPRPYTIWLAFVSGDALGERPPPVDAARAFPGSAALADSLARRGDLDRVRLVVFFDALYDPSSPADLHVARDLRSHRIHREAFWDSARALGLDEVFVAEEPFSAPVTGHRALLDREVRGVVAITASAPGGLRPGDAAETGGEPDEDAVAVRLSELGTVVLDALDRIAVRLSRIDGFATAPVSDSDGWSGTTGGPGMPSEPEASPDAGSADADAGDEQAAPGPTMPPARRDRAR